ncbi:MAG TPA: DUF2470 domain-containing protein [Burkholderiales bacterium]|nr:DUF2470 domain-containing protein [Burkholderiales bacterium]
MLHYLAALPDYCRLMHGLQTYKAEIVGIDCDGFDIRTDGARLHFDFAQPVRDAGQARSELVALAREARG